MKNFSCRALQVFFRRPVYISNYFSCATDTCDHLKKKVQSPDFTRSNQIFILPLVRMVCATVNHILLESRCYLIPFGIIVHSTMLHCKQPPLKKIYRATLNQKALID